MGAILKHLSAILIHCMQNHLYNSKEQCKNCKATLEVRESILYVLPCRFDEQHEETAQYYMHNTVRIEDESQIPTGQRACYFNIVICPGCGERQVNIVDFLQVREQKIIKAGSRYPYSVLKNYIENNQKEI
ncbi:MAG: hypothetical protein Q4D51_10130 [Eubacteriales bacterium]|nr:hypothetical protein [Eubacteriales bacterium]